MGSEKKRKRRDGGGGGSGSHDGSSPLNAPWEETGHGPCPRSPRHRDR